MNRFISETKPYYSEKKIISFAHKISTHPGIVVGQLQCKKEIPYSNFRKHLVKIRNFLFETAFVDGWGIISKTI